MNYLVKSVATATVGAGSLFFASAALSQEKLGEIVPKLSLAYYAADMGPVYEQSARVLSQEWAKLGLEFQMRPIQFSTFVSDIIVGGKLEDMAVFSVGADPDRIDPVFYLNNISACGQRANGSSWCNEEYTRLAEKQLTQVNSDERRETIHQMQELFQSQIPWWPVTNTVYGILYNSDKWENVTNPSPVAAHENLVDPWLAARPLTDDRIMDWAYLEDVSTYNPMSEEGATGWMRFVYDTFAKIGADGKSRPWAAESWEFTDDTTVRVTLRDDMTFHDGEAVTADDAVFTINKIVEIQPPTMSSRIGNIAGATKIDDHTFEFNLKTPDATFETIAMTYLFILPEHLWADYEGDMVNRDVVADGVAIGSGPFMFKEWRVNELHDLRTHKAHFAAPAYDGIRRLALGQADAIRSTMLDGTADIATTVLPVAAMSDLGMQEDFLEFIEIPSHGTMMTWLNNTKPPFSDLEFRRALKTATARQRAAIEGWLGFAVPAGEGNVPRQTGQWYNSDLEPVAFDIDAARKILEDAGYGWDDDGRLHYPVK
ncbi:hypothetical protein I5535_02660 [Rhodobacteraceae bacterium F11138]|nr:hypothetical protein [Rhodobacteraceae bacterium F11138]